MNAMILAAGHGTRFQPYTNQLAKPALPFLGMPLLGFPISYLRDFSIKKLVVNTHHLENSVVKAASSVTLNSSFELVFSHEKTLLGSGGGIKKAEDHFKGGGDFFVINGDTLFLLNHANGLKPLLDSHKKNNALATLLTIKPPSPIKKGVWTNNKNQVLSFRDKPTSKNSINCQHYIGAMILSEQIFEYLPDGASCILLDGLAPAIQKNEIVQTYVDDALWFETGDKESFFKAREHCWKQLKLNESSFFKKNLVKALNSYHTDINFSEIGPYISPSAKVEKKSLRSNEILVGQEVKIDPRIQLHEQVAVGPNSSLSGAAKLYRCEVHERVNTTASGEFRGDLILTSKQNS